MVRFRGEDKNQIIDWESAKEHAIDIMEFFGSRTIWTEMKNIMDPDMNDEFTDDAGENASENAGADQNARPSTSQLDQLDNCPNEIEYEK